MVVRVVDAFRLHDESDSEAPFAHQTSLIMSDTHWLRVAGPTGIYRDRESSGAKNIARASVLSPEPPILEAAAKELSQSLSHTALEHLAIDCLKPFPMQPQRVFKTCAVW